MANATCHQVPKLGVICGAGLAMLLTISPANADWKSELTRQMRDDFGCKVEYMSHIIERKIGDKILISAKVHCEDKRAFDATRDRPLQRFMVRRCPVQKSC